MDKPKLIIYTDLASKLGINEAIVLSQIYYWQNKNTLNKRRKNYNDGYYWVYLSAKEWQEKNFPFWSINTVRNILNKLERD